MNNIRTGILLVSLVASGCGGKVDSEDDGGVGDSGSPADSGSFVDSGSDSGTSSDAGNFDAAIFDAGPFEGTIHRTSQLGWVDGEDVSSKMRSFLASTFRVGDMLLVDGMYQISGHGYALPDDVVLRGGLPDQQAGFRGMDGVRELADRNGLPFDGQPIFEAGNNLRVENLYFTQDRIDPSLLWGGGTKGGWFEVSDVDGFVFVDNKADTSGWTIVRLGGVNGVLFEGNTFDSPKAGISSIGLVTNFWFVGNFVTGGYTGRTLDGSREQIFMDLIKTTYAGPDNVLTGAVFADNVFTNIVRDGIDTTGGLPDAEIYNNVFNRLFASLDLKSAYEDNGRSKAKGVIRNTNIDIHDNLLIGAPIVLTTTFRDSQSPDPRFSVQDIYSRNNIFLGSGHCFLIKDSRRLFSTGDFVLGRPLFKLVDNYGLNGELSFIDVLKDSLGSVDTAYAGQGFTFQYQHLHLSRGDKNEIGLRLQSSASDVTMAGPVSSEVSVDNVVDDQGAQNVTDNLNYLGARSIHDGPGNNLEPDLSDAVAATGVDLTDAISREEIRLVRDWFFQQGRARRDAFVSAVGQ